jgi:hypothetical protein
MGGWGSRLNAFLPNDRIAAGVKTSDDMNLITFLPKVDFVWEPIKLSASGISDYRREVVWFRRDTSKLAVELQPKPTAQTFRFFLVPILSVERFPTRSRCENNGGHYFARASISAFRSSQVVPVLMSSSSVSRRRSNSERCDCGSGRRSASILSQRSPISSRRSSTDRRLISSGDRVPMPPIYRNFRLSANHARRRSCGRVDLMKPAGGAVSARTCSLMARGSPNRWPCA